MDDTMRMQVLQCVNNLHSVALDFKLMQPLPAFEKFVHALVLTQLKQDVDVLRVFEEVLELADVGVLDASVNFDLAHQLLLRAALCQR
jgi:hypothetical protein